MREELFITKIKINEVRHLRDLEIPLSETERKHLILTGRNGSGKTSVLEALAYQLSRLSGASSLILESRREFYERLGKDGCEISLSHGTLVEWQDWDLNKRIDPQRHVLVVLFPARRGLEFRIPTGTSAIAEPSFYASRNHQLGSGKEFLQHLVNLYTDKAILKEQGKEAEAELRKVWLARFENLLRRILDSPDALLTYELDARGFKISEPGKKPYSLSELSDGYGGVLSIISEIIMRMPNFGLTGFDAQGIVLIDEIETHLHIELQEKIFPLLNDLFPHLQFIVTTHSPFVINSVKNAVICDLEKRIVVEDLSQYSSQAIAKAYFDADDYSVQLQHDVAEYEGLLSNTQLDLLGRDRLAELEEQLSRVPDFFSDSLQIKLQQIKLKYKRKTA